MNKFRKMGLIDYNGHLRDAYYVLILSLATDALMDRIGLDAAYRARTHCTLYTLEMHVHYLHEVKQSDTVLVKLRVLGADHKRLHAGCSFCPWHAKENASRTPGRTTWKSNRKSQHRAR